MTPPRLFVVIDFLDLPDQRFFELWADNISLVGTNVDGFSNTSIDPADAATYLRIPVSMAASEAGKVISLRVTYGSDTPAP